MVQAELRLGWVLSLAIGVGGGAIIWWFLGSPWSSDTHRTRLEYQDTIEILEAYGTTMAEDIDMETRLIRRRDRVLRPVALRTLNKDSRLVIQLLGATLSLEGEGRLFVGVRGRRVQLDIGRLIVSSKKPFTVYMPQYGFQVDGLQFILRLASGRPPRVAVLGDTAKLRTERGEIVTLAQAKVYELSGERRSWTIDTSSLDENMAASTQQKGASSPQPSGDNGGQPQGLLSSLKAESLTSTTIRSLRFFDSQFVDDQKKSELDSNQPEPVLGRSRRQEAPSTLKMDLDGPRREKNLLSKEEIVPNVER